MVKNSKFAALQKLMMKIQAKVQKFKKPEDAEAYMKLLITQHIGELYTILSELMLNASADDLRILSTETKLIATVLRFEITQKDSKHEAEKQKLFALIAEGEKTLQSNYLLMAKKLKGGKKENADIIELITGNMPKDCL